jgi:hypothetical protein
MGGPKIDIVESYRLDVKGSLAQYHTTMSGLRQTEAFERQEKFGANRLHAAHKDTLAIRFALFYFVSNYLFLFA